jgi:uncharacterized repeat protein (TIGR01451 family)
VFTALFFVLSSLLFVGQTAAQTPNNGCQPIFGGGTTCIQSGSLVVDKKIRDPRSDRFVDQLSSTYPRYAPDQTVVFQITLHNTGNRAIEDITVTDIFPQYVSFTKGPGEFDTANNTLMFVFSKLDAGQSRSFTIEGKVAPARSIPATAGITCVVNQARGEKDRNVSTDNTQFCLQTAGTQPQQNATPQQPGQPQPTQTTMPVYEAPNAPTSPNTGPELLGLIGLLPLGAAGMYLRKYSAK